MVTDTATEKFSLGPVAKLWLLFSVLLNVSGIASIIDGFFRWQGFFRDFLDLYHAWIRHPVSWAIHLVWPASWPRIPKSIIDVLIVWSGFFLAVNLWFLRTRKKLFVQAAIEDEGIFKGIISVIIGFFAYPLVIVFSLLQIRVPLLDVTGEDFNPALETALYFLFLVSCVIVLMFLNWQFQHHGQI